MGQPAVAEAFAAAEQDPTLLPDAIARRLAAQEALGIKPEDRRALTKSEEQEVLEGVRNLPPEQQAAALASFRGTYGDRIGPVVAQLEEAGIHPFLTLIVEPNSDPTLARRIAETLSGDGPSSASSPSETGIIGEAAARLLAEGERGARGAGGSAVDAPPLPLRKPFLKRIFNETAVLEKYQDLRSRSIEESFGFMGGVPTYGRRGAKLGEDLAKKGASEELRELAQLLVLQKGVMEGNGLERAYRLAADELGFKPLIEPGDYTFDNSIDRPRHPGSSLEEAQAIADITGLDLDIEDENTAKIMLPALQRFWGIREAAQQGGAVAFEEVITGVVEAAREARLDLSMADVRDLAWDAIDNPIDHPWVQTPTELADSIGRLADVVEKAGDDGLLSALRGVGVTIMEFIPALNAVSKTIGVVKSVWDVHSALSSEEASDLLAKSIKEYFRRRDARQRPR